MNAIQMSKSLGLLSLAVGTVELVAGGRLKRTLGLPVSSMAVRALGARELLAGFVGLAHPDNKGPMALRLAGDALDLAVLGAALLPGNRRRGAAALATIAVVAVTVADFAAAAALARREHQALATARRTRVKTILG